MQKVNRSIIIKLTILISEFTEREREKHNFSYDDVTTMIIICWNVSKLTGSISTQELHLFCTGIIMKTIIIKRFDPKIVLPQRCQTHDKTPPQFTMPAGSVYVMHPINSH